MNKKLIRSFMLLILSIIFLLISFYVYSENKPKDKNNDEIKIKEENIKEEKKEDEIYSLSLIATGDALIHQAVYNSAYSNGNYDFKPLLELVKPIIQKHDLAFYNQETIFGGEELGYSHYPRFNTPSEFGDAMLDAGFNLVALSNNHSYDKGEKGVLNAIEYWDEQSVIFNGINNSVEMQNDIQINTKNNISYSLLSYTMHNNGLNTPSGKEYLVNYYSDERAKKDINYLKEKGIDVIIVSMHWGNEYSHNPTQTQKDIANFLSNQGVNIIVGHHPHVLQPIEKINETIVMYSLGNFVSAQVGIEKLTGALVSLNITKEIKDDKINISLNAPSVELIFTDKSRKYLVIPFSQINNNYLVNYQSAYNNAVKIITSFDKDINIVPLPNN